MSNSWDLRPAVLDYRAGSWHLGRDFTSLRVVHSAGAHDASVFYAGRLLEVTARSSLDELGLDVSPNTFHNLAVLESVGLLAGADLYTSHTLRRLGNAARHGLEPLNADDADAAVCLLASWLEWFFVRRPSGPGLPGLCTTAAAWEPAARPSGRLTTRVLRDVLHREVPSDDVSAALLDDDDSAGIWRRAIVALTAEAMIDWDDLVRAEEFLRLARARAPDDPRLIQLDALRHRRGGDPHRAIQLLDPVHRAGSGDEELIGILAASYKSRSKSGKHPEDLKRAHELYRHGWRASRRRNAWLGVNAAVTALFLGDEVGARELAEDVRTRLEQRERQLVSETRLGKTLPFYFVATLAESLLLGGEEGEARARYRNAFESHPHLKGAQRSAREQGRDILRCLGRGQTFDHWLAGPSPEER